MNFIVPEFIVNLLSTMETRLLYKIHISGRVQGVGFRWSALREARIYQINGVVKNLPDGSVYIEAEGNPEQLALFVDWCRKGPDRSYIESVTVDSFPPVNYTDFRIES
jgi:acylphosphatase